MSVDVKLVVTGMLFLAASAVILLGGTDGIAALSSVWMAPTGGGASAGALVVGTLASERPADRHALERTAQPDGESTRIAEHHCWTLSLNTTAERRR